MDGSVHQSQNHIQVGHVNPSFIRGRCRRTGTQLLQHGAKMSVTFLVVVVGGVVGSLLGLLIIY